MRLIPPEIMIFSVNTSLQEFKKVNSAVDLLQQ